MCIAVVRRGPWLATVAWWPQAGFPTLAHWTSPRGSITEQRVRAATLVPSKTPVLPTVLARDSRAPRPCVLRSGRGARGRRHDDSLVRGVGNRVCPPSLSGVQWEQRPRCGAPASAQKLALPLQHGAHSSAQLGTACSSDCCPHTVRADSRVRHPRREHEPASSRAHRPSTDRFIASFQTTVSSSHSNALG